MQQLPDGARQDPIWARSGHTGYGRDGCRVPLPWRAEGASFGFSARDASAPPWLPQPAWFADFAADQQTTDPASVLSFYRRALRARRRSDAADELEWLETGRDEVLAFRRGQVSCVTVFDGEPFAPPGAWGQLFCASGHDVLADGALASDTTAWYQG